MTNDPMIELGARMREQQAYDEMNAAWDKEERASGARSFSTYSDQTYVRHWVTYGEVDRALDALSKQGERE